MYYILLGVQIFCVLSSFICTIYVISEKVSFNQELLSYGTIALMIELLGYLFEMLSNTKNEALLAVKMEYFGLVFINMFTLFFVLNNCIGKIHMLIRIIIVGFDLLFLVCSMSCEYHDLFYKDISYVNSGMFPHLVFSYGIVFYMLIVYNIILFVIQIISIIRYFFKNKSKVSKQIMFLLSAYLFPIAGFLFYFTPYWRQYHYAPIYVLTAIGEMIFLFLIMRFRLFDTAMIDTEDIIRNINEGLIVTDVNRKMLFANDLALSVFPQLNDNTYRISTINRIYRSNKKDMEVGNRVYSVSVVPFYDRKLLKGYNLWFFDKTEEREYTNKVIEIKNQAEEANKSKTLFLANMSHEIRTPMNAILGTVDIMLRESISPEIEELALSIKNAGNVLIGIINDVLDFSKIESGKVSSNDEKYQTGLLLKQLSDNARERLQQKNIAFNVYVNPTLPSYMYGDITHVRQIYTNLLNNAIKYTKSGCVTMNVDWEMVNGTAKIRVSVEDTGCGIAEENLDSIFDSFQRADMIKNRTIEGTGLGLAIAKRLTESMGGTISVKSVYGEGSIFSFYYFQGIVDYNGVGNIDEISYEGEKQSKEETFIAPMARILIVDDNVTNIKVIQGLLGIYKIRVDTALSGMEAIEKAGKNHYHMIFMDQMMPIMDGIEAAAKIRLLPGSEHKHVPIVALTANAISGAREMFINAGFQDYISKPMDINLLEKILKSYLPSDFIRYVEKNDETVYLGGEIRIPEVDSEKGIATYGNSRLRYIQVLKYMYTDGEKQISRMRSYEKQREYEKLSFEVHALKGLAYGIGADILGDYAKECDLLIRGEKKGDIEESVHELVDRYEMLLANIRFFLNSIDNNEDEKTATPKIENNNYSSEPITKKQLLNRLEDVLETIEMLQQKEADIIIGELLTTPEKEYVKKSLLEARSYLADYEYDDATAVINELIVKVKGE